MLCDEPNDCDPKLICAPHELGQDRGKVGICAPGSCDDNGCPSLGCLCNPHCLALQPGQCNTTSNTCNYNGPRPVAKCIPYENQVRDTSNDNQLIACDTNLDCPEGLNHCHGNPSSPSKGYCGPRNCLYDTCPQIGNNQDGFINGVCNEDDYSVTFGKCNYNFE